MIAQAHVVAMERVDQVKVSPHEPVAAIYAVQAALENAAPGVKLAARRKAIALERFRRHASRLKGNPVVAVPLIEPPVFVKQPTLVLQPAIQRRAGERGEVIERGDVKGVFLREFHGGGKTFRSVAVVAEDKRAINADVMAAQIREGLFKAAA